MFTHLAIELSWAVVFGRPEIIICQLKNKTKLLISFKHYVAILTLNNDINKHEQCMIISKYFYLLALFRKIEAYFCDILALIFQ